MLPLSTVVQNPKYVVYNLLFVVQHNKHSRHEPAMDCRSEPPCVVTDIPKRDIHKQLRLRMICAVSTVCVAYN